MFSILRLFNMLYVLCGIIVVSSVMLVGLLVNQVYEFIVKGLFDAPHSLKKVS